MVLEQPIPVAIVLHAYQPVTQKIEILERIINNCYLPFFENLIKKPNLKITLNISGCLLEKLAVSYPDVLMLLEKGIQSGQIELMGSAFFHPILPLMTIDNQKYQIGKQKEIIQNIFGFNTKVFFPPELAITEKLIPQITEKGYQTIIVPENSFEANYGAHFVMENGKQITVVKRNKEISNFIAFNKYQRNATACILDLEIAYRQTKQPIVLAMDLETFGEHHSEYYYFFFNLLDRLETFTLSNCLERYPITEMTEQIVASSWSTTNTDLENKIPYPLWDHPSNPVHQLQHAHLQLLEQIKQYLMEGDWYDDYHASHYSCQFWWASNVWWAPELIHTGLKHQRNTLGKMLDNLSEDAQQIIFNLSNDIIKKIIDIVSKVEDKNEDSIYFR